MEPSTIQEFMLICANSLTKEALVDILHERITEYLADPSVSNFDKLLTPCMLILQKKGIEVSGGLESLSRSIQDQARFQAAFSHTKNMQ